ncbi:hypothetical protein N7490_010724 [Penicillium lividum]|nr:hypothetical protein N7490_010724 [Penicillium lividum]
MDIVRDSPIGQILRWITGNRVLLYPEELPGFCFSISEEKTKQPVEQKQILENDSTTTRRNSSSADSSNPPPQTVHDLSHGRSTEETHVVEWDGPEDPTNPRNWSPLRKKITAAQICLYTFVVYCGSAIYVPTESQIMERFQVSQTEASLGLALYVLGYGLGPLLFSPMSEVPAYGRNVPYITSFFIFVILCIPTALVDNYPGLMILRFLQGFFGSPCLASGGASMGDMYNEIYVPLLLTSWVAAAYCGPALGPVLSAFAIVKEGWRWAMWEILWMSGPVFCIMLVFLPETSPDTILLRRAQRLRRITGNPNIFSHSEIERDHLTFGQEVLISLAKPIEIMMKDPAILFTNIYTSLVYGIYYSFFEAFPMVYPIIYGFTLGETALVFIAIVIACVIGVTIYIIYLYTYLMPDLIQNGHRAPEHRLIPAIFASLTVPVGLFIFAWTSRDDINWSVSAVGIMIYGASVFIILQCIFVYVPLVYPKYAASLFAGNDFSRSGFAFAFILFARPMFQNLGVDKGVTVLAGLSILGIIGMFFLYFYGAKLRARSHFAVA